MRPFLFALALLAACDDFESVKRADTVEAYEAWLAENGTDGSKAGTALLRLEELLRTAAREKQTPAAYEAYLTRFPTHKNAAELRAEYETMMFDLAELAGTPEAWAAFQKACPDVKGQRAEWARNAAQAAAYAQNLKIGEVRVEKINLANDPKGELNGTAFLTEVTNNGDQTLEMLWFNLYLLAGEGKVARKVDAPLVAPQRMSRMPIPDANQAPLKPGDTRTFRWTTGELPEGFSGVAKLVPARIAVLGRAGH